VANRGKPIKIKTNNRSEFFSMVMDKWAIERGLLLDFSRPGKSTDNTMVEIFDG
jgi:putative transposase